MACNAKIELQTVLDNLSAKVVCAQIYYQPNFFSRMDDEEEDKGITLRVGHTEQELQDFLDKLDFTYDDGYGGQELFGKVWLTDGVWLTRGEYDGSEWWDIHQYPQIPEELSTLAVG